MDIERLVRSVMSKKKALFSAHGVRVHAERLGCELVELNVQADHVHLLVKIPPKVSVSSLMGTLKGVLV